MEAPTIGQRVVVHPGPAWSEWFRHGAGGKLGTVIEVDARTHPGVALIELDERPYSDKRGHIPGKSWWLAFSDIAEVR